MTRYQPSPPPVPSPDANGTGHSRRRRPARRRLLTGLVLTALVGSGLAVLTPVEAAAGPRQQFQMPFPCGAKFDGATYDGHGTGSADGRRGNDFAIDFNKTGTSGNADRGEIVIASAAGTARVIRDGGGLGKYVRISHRGGWRTYYAHLSRFSVKDGAQVKAGQRIGRIGKTGNAASTHLHYEQRLNGRSTFVHFNGKRLTPGYSYTYNGPTYTSRNCKPSTPEVVDKGVSAVVRNSGREAVFTRANKSGRLAQQLRKSNGHWTKQLLRRNTKLGSGPDATSRTPGTYSIIARSTNGRVIIAGKNKKTWYGFRTLSKFTTPYAPAITAVGSKTMFALAVRTKDHALMRNRWQAGKGWQGWGKVRKMSGFTSGPDATQKHGRRAITVAIRDKKGNIRTTTWRKNAWTSYRNWGQPNATPKPGSAPAIASRKSGAIDVMVQGRQGSIHRKTRNNGKVAIRWHAPNSNWRINHGPDLAAHTTTGQLQLFARNKQGQPVTANWKAGNGWNKFHRLT